MSHIQHTYHPICRVRYMWRANEKQRRGRERAHVSRLKFARAWIKADESPRGRGLAYKSATLIIRTPVSSRDLPFMAPAATAVTAVQRLCASSRIKDRVVAMVLFVFEGIE